MYYTYLKGSKRRNGVDGVSKLLSAAGRRRVGREKENAGERWIQLKIQLNK